MGVYIPGMEMPKEGRLEAVIHVHKDGMATIAISPADDEIGYWHEYPFILVSPHGRLIDKDVLERDEVYTSEYGFQDVFWADQIDYAPTIIPADTE